MMTSLVLARSPRLRYAVGASMYFAQGIPQGLLGIAIPAWLASKGVSASEIGSYLAVIVLPWAFKLLTGPLMDRFEYRPMGRRRPWILAAQLGLSLSLLSLMLVDQPEQQIGLLMVLGVLINSFAATQDVAVDGMAIELAPVLEQGRLNAFMSFGKTIGWAVTAAVSGAMLVRFGLDAVAVLASVVAGLMLIVMIVVRERDAEKRLPWSPGRSASDSISRSSFAQVFSGVRGVLFTRTSLLIMAIMLFDGLIYGYGHALMPIAAVQLFGLTTPQWSNLVAVMGLAGAGLALAMGPLIDRLGARRMLILVIALLGAHALLLAQTQHLWQDTVYVRVMLALWILLLPVTMVAVLALAMAICSTGVSATQFAIYMSVANLGNSAGSKIYGTVADQVTWVQSYTLLAILVGCMIAILLLHRDPHRDEGNGKDRSRRHGAARHTLGLGVGEAGMFSTGALSCPKCSAAMEPVMADGHEVDRCTRCAGIWFDAGELDWLAQSEIAEAIDTGDVREGRAMNEVTDVDCPRCGRGMQHVPDEHKPDIHYEVCVECEGAFLDAGEFRDLARLSLAEVVKALFATARR